MLSVVIVIVIVLLSIILAGIGAYVVIHSADEKEEIKPVIDVSGKYAVPSFSPSFITSLPPERKLLP